MLSYTLNPFLKGIHSQWKEFAPKQGLIIDRFQKGGKTILQGLL